ncbi:MAG TPA: hypothetical protein VHC69_20890 [Polyangiaceae bacterium]|nr:hypothetical protein [Polyangiaceae bacterium]
MVKRPSQPPLKASVRWSVLGGVAACLLLVTAAPDLAAAPKAHRVVSGELNENKTEWKAGATGAVVALDDGVVLRLGPDARVRWWPNTHLSLGGASATPTDALGLLEGTVVVEDPISKRKTGRAVLVQVPGGLAGVTAGGRLQVVTDGRSSAIANLEGTAWASPKGASHSLDPGTGWSTSWLGGNPFAIAPAPTLTATRHAFSGIAGDATIDGIQWSKIEGARSYVMRFGPEGSGATETLQTTEPSQPRALRVPPGEYRATVAAVDEHGLEGPESTPLSLRVVGVSLPSSAALADDGSVNIAEREPVPLTHATGLLVAYGGAREWNAAPLEVRLFRGESTVVRFRDPRDAAGFELRLEPRRLAVQVSVGPKRLVWPGDPVRIAIRATDGHGGAAPPNVELHPVVTLGIEPLPVEFTRQGSSLVAEVPTPADAGPGPWIVRVQVNDQFGNSVGRDFVEIGRRPPAKKPSPADTSPVSYFQPPAAGTADTRPPYR